MYIVTTVLVLVQCFFTSENPSLKGYISCILIQMLPVLLSYHLTLLLNAHDGSAAPVDSDAQVDSATRVDSDAHVDSAAQAISAAQLTEGGLYSAAHGTLLLMAQCCSWYSAAHCRVLLMVQCCSWYSAAHMAQCCSWFSATHMAQCCSWYSAVHGTVLLIVKYCSWYSAAHGTLLLIWHSAETHTLY